jgi:hypothetical protein
MYTGVVVEFVNETLRFNGFMIFQSFEDADKFMKKPQLYITHDHITDYVKYCEPKLCNWHYENRNVAEFDKEIKIQVYELIH